MLFEKARYLSRIDENTVWVETRIKTSCQSCQHNSSCGTGVIARAFSGKTNRVKAICRHSVKPDEIVTLQVAEQNIIQAAFILYGIPLLSIIISAVLLDHFFTAQPNDDFYTLIGVFLGGVLGFKFAKYQADKVAALPQVIEQAEVKIFSCVEE
ncbi:SoxR reducing system RseC family protein [Catenovulum sp. SM1970]|uniref:SoxR reducing system RseC family protein n=1 Tax=Marinifaba aquimaris TaxID=2741323 RepID=UPI00157438F0|nr:SoxR reducing system RseC family protein [Marinifaba aquimaris]NTS76425.1 SoxR reducing system RseC family protein [Marinifaba aquimaris]